MPDTYLSTAGEVVARDMLRLSRAIALAQALAVGAPYAWLVECRRLTDAEVETIVLEVEPEIPQRPAQGIRGIERIAVSFEASDAATPEVRALRTDFPLVPHINLRREALPRSLCLYDEPWPELQLHWTPAELITRLREWLAKTARNQLHAADQPLEPLLFGSPWTIVVPAELLRGEEREGGVPAPLRVRKMEAGADRVTLLAEVFEPPKEDGAKTVTPEVVATTFVAKPQAHGVIHKQPVTLQALAELLAPAGVELLPELRSRLGTWQRECNYQDFHQARLALVVVLPKTRAPGSAVEATETWAFIAVQTIAEVGEQIGVWGLSEGVPGLLIGADETKQGDEIGLALLNPTETFTRERAARLSGLGPRDGRNVVAVGLGALGSQVFLNLVRTGFGEWVLIDPDLLLPHNLARHALTGSFVGSAKAEAMALLANDLFRSEPIAHSLMADILDPGEASEELGAALQNADIVLDTSASIAVARHLARDVDTAARRVSLFLSPTGDDAVLLAEDTARTIPLDLLEMQYYRHLTRNPKLADHLQGKQGTVRYGAGCRDRSGVILQDLVALHAANGSRALRAALTEKDARITIFKTEPGGLDLESIQVPTVQADEVQWGDWTLYADRQLLEEIAQARTEKLPNETGGVLIGAFDTHRRIIYVVDQVPSPPDSKEWPTMYIRGAQGLRERIEDIDRITAGNLVYVGEWHSHPDGARCSPSNDDRQVFAWLGELRSADGLPPVMLIVGEQEHYGWSIDEIEKEK